MGEVVIKAENISKAYKIYEKDIDRVKEALIPFHKRYSKDFYALRDVRAICFKKLRPHFADVL